MPIVTTVRGRDRPGPHIFIAIPCHGEISAQTFSAFFEGAQLLDAAGFTVTLCTEAGNCHVDDARNSLTREFLKTDATDFVFIDADVGFRAEDLLRLVSVDRDIVAGVYPKKQSPEDFPVYTLGGVELRADTDGLVEVEAVPTGFLRIRRAVIETLADKAVSFIGQAGDSLPYHVIFERIVDSGRRWSGDYAFCRKAKAAGYRIFVDPEMGFTHTGANTWSGSLGAFWKRKHGVEGQLLAQGFDDAVTALKSGKAKAEHFIALAQGWGNGWSASPELLVHIYRRCRGRVLECGSGLSTFIMAAAGCEVTALEHDPMWASFLQAMLDRYDLRANIVCKPLSGEWYDFAGGDYDCLVIDGPPRTRGNRAEALNRVRADLIIWDDYEDGLDDPEIVEAEGKRFAVLKRERASA
jgi:predicted O-methyltransferase YrrM